MVRSLLFVSLLAASSALAQQVAAPESPVPDGGGGIAEVDGHDSAVGVGSDGGSAARDDEGSGEVARQPQVGGHGGGESCEYGAAKGGCGHGSSEGASGCGHGGGGHGGSDRASCGHGGGDKASCGHGGGDQGSCGLGDGHRGASHSEWGHAHSHGRTDPWRLSVGVGLFANRGGGAELSVRPRAHSRWSVGLAYSRQADHFDDARYDRSGRGGFGYHGRALKDVDVKQSFSLVLDRQFRHGRGGPYAGLRLGASQLRFRALDQPGFESNFWATTATPQLGYTFFPFRRSFFLRPELQATFSFAPRGSYVLNGARYRAPVVLPSAGVLAGFAF